MGDHALPEHAPDALDILAGAEALDTHLTTWETRDDTKAQPEVRRAAKDAMTAIDGLLRDLHAMRIRLMAQIRDCDDAAAVRTDALLARLRDGGA